MFLLREGVKKNRIYLGLCPKLWVGGSRSRSKVPNFLVKISIQLFLLQTSRNVLKHVIHKWGGHIWPFHDALRPQRFWNFGILSEKFLIFSKKIKCSKQPKKQNKLNFYFSLSGVLNVRSGWVGSDVWDIVPNKSVFFYTFPYIVFRMLSKINGIMHFFGCKFSKPSLTIGV